METLIPHWHVSGHDVWGHVTKSLKSKERKQNLFTTKAYIILVNLTKQDFMRKKSGWCTLHRSMETPENRHCILSNFLEISLVLSKTKTVMETQLTHNLPRRPPLLDPPLGFCETAAEAGQRTQHEHSKTVPMTPRLFRVCVCVHLAHPSRRPDANLQPSVTTSLLCRAFHQ